MPHEFEGTTGTLVDVASLVSASAAAARAFALGVRAGLRSLLSAGVRLGAETLIAEHQTAARPDAARRGEPAGYFEWAFVQLLTLLA